MLGEGKRLLAMKSTLLQLLLLCVFTFTFAYVHMESIHLILCFYSDEFCLLFASCFVIIMATQLPM